MILRGVGYLFFVSLVWISSSTTTEAAKRPSCGQLIQNVGKAEGFEQSNLRNEIDAQLASQLSNFIKKNRRIPSWPEFAAAVGAESKDLRAYISAKGSRNLEPLVRYLLENQPQAFSPLQDSWAKAYARLARQTMREPTPEMLASVVGFHPKDLLIFFGEGRVFQSWKDLDQHARSLMPKHFEAVIKDEFLSPAAREALAEKLRSHSTYLVTTAVAGAPLSKGFDALLKMAEEKNALLLIRPVNFKTDGLDPRLLDLHATHPLVFITLDGAELGQSMALSKVQIIAKMMHPSRGLKRLYPRGQSQVIGATKQEVVTVHTVKNNQLPHRVISSGAITVPEYAGAKPIQKRTDEFAHEEHFIGAVLVEKAVDQAEGFFVRHLEYIPEKNGFWDLGTLYTDKGVQFESVDTIVLGDWHEGETDPAIVASLPEIVQEFSPKRLVLHDIFNGHSVNRHERGKTVTLAQRQKYGRLGLEGEVREIQQRIKWFQSLNPDVEIVIVKSNHDLWLNQWLETGEFTKEPVNALYGAKLFAAAVEGKDPLEFAVRENADFDQSRVRFLQAGDGFEVGPAHRKVQVGIHGHAAAGGKPGSIMQFKEAAGRIVYGHTHTYARRNATVNVGTSTLLDVGYNRDGFSNWVQSLALVGPNGEIQVLEFRNGQWYRSAEQTEGENTFSPQYPRVIAPSQVSSPTGQVDQWSDF
jgi:hypothetical protein